MKNQITKGQKLAGVGIAFLVLIIGGAIMLQTSKADNVKSLQENVEVSQVVYDTSYIGFMKAAIKTCEDQKVLAKAKLQLSTALKLNGDNKAYDEAATRDCSKITPSLGF